MKYIIYPENQGTITAISENANYPATNLSTEIRAEKWKAETDVEEATLRVPIAANSKVVAIDNTNAETAVVTITLDSAEQAIDNAAAVDIGGGLVSIPLTGHGYSEGDQILLNGTMNYDGVHTLPTQAAGDVDNIIITATYAAETFAGTETACIIVQTTTHTLETGSRSYDAFFELYTEQVAAHTATIKLTAGTGETVEAGVCRAGGIVTVKNPLQKPREDTVNYHIEDRYKSGAKYGVKKDEVRRISYSMALLRDTEYRTFEVVRKYYGPAPCMMLITDNLTDYDWIIWGCIVGTATASHDTAELSIVSVSVLQEV